MYEYQDLANARQGIVHAGSVLIACARRTTSSYQWVAFAAGLVSSTTACPPRVKWHVNHLVDSVTRIRWVAVLKLLHVVPLHYYCVAGFCLKGWLAIIEEFNKQQDVVCESVWRVHVRGGGQREREVAAGCLG